MNRIAVKLLSLSALIFFPQLSLAAGGADHPHHVAVFVGATNSSSKTAFTLGGDYEYRLSALDGNLGVGAIVDNAFFTDAVLIVAGALFYHIADHYKLILGVGSESSHGHTSTVVRAGVAYDFHMEGYSLSPAFSVDTANGHSSYVFGVNIGRGF